MTDTNDPARSGAPGGPAEATAPVHPWETAGTPQTFMQWAERLDRESGRAAPMARRPEWLPEPFWDAEANAPRYEALAKSWTDLRRRVGEKYEPPPPSPDDYDMPELEGVPAGSIRPDDPLWRGIREAAHKAGIGKRQMQALVAAYFESARKMASGTADPETYRARVEQEMAKLGPNGRAVVRDVNGWVTGLVARGVLTQDEAESLRAVADAAGVRALAKLKGMLGEKPIPIDHLVSGANDQVEEARRRLAEAMRTGNASLGEVALEGLRRLRKT